MRKVWKWYLKNSFNKLLMAMIILAVGGTIGYLVNNPNTILYTIGIGFAPWIHSINQDQKILNK